MSPAKCLSIPSGEFQSDATDQSALKAMASISEGLDCLPCLQEGNLSWDMGRATWCLSESGDRNQDQALSSQFLSTHRHPKWKSHKYYLAWSRPPWPGRRRSLSFNSSQIVFLAPDTSHALTHPWVLLCTNAFPSTRP